MAGPGLEQGDRAVRRFGNPPGGEDPGAIRTGARRQRIDARLLGAVENAHRRGVVVEHRALGRCTRASVVCVDAGSAVTRARVSSIALRVACSASDEAVTGSEVPGRGAEAQTSAQSPGAKGPGLHLFADALHRAEGMGIGDQGIEASFSRRAANRPRFDRAQGVERSFERPTVHLHRRAMALFGGQWRTAGKRMGSAR